MTEARRVRTQAERDADGTAWHPGGVVNGNPLNDELHADECVLVLREGAGVMCIRDHPHDSDAPGIALRRPPPDKSWIEMECAPPRRRWWHRLTRRAL